MIVKLYSRFLVICSKHVIKSGIVTTLFPTNYNGTLYVDFTVIYRTAGLAITGW